MVTYTATDKGWIAKVRVTNKAELDSMMDQVLLKIYGSFLFLFARVH
jgi:hypothetical protein